MARKIIILIVFVNLLLPVGCSQPEQGKVCFKDKCFNVEIVREGKKYSQGLMFRTRLGHDKGMLFISEKEENYGFWMKNTYIPLDIIWIDRAEAVVFIKENAQPCKSDPCPAFRPPKKTKYVLELNAGAVEDMGLNLSDKLTFDFQ